MTRTLLSLCFVALLIAAAVAQDTTVAATTTAAAATTTAAAPITTAASPITTAGGAPATTVAVPPATTVAVPPATTVAVPPATTVVVPPATTVAAGTTVAAPPQTTVAAPPVTTAQAPATTAAGTTAAAPPTTAAQMTTVAATTAAPLPTTGGATCSTQCNCYCPAPATTCKDELIASAASKCGQASLDTTNMTQIQWLDLCDTCLYYVKREWSTICPEYDSYVAMMKADCRCVVRNQYACAQDGRCSWDDATGNCRAVSAAAADNTPNANGEVVNGQCNCGGSPMNQKPSSSSHQNGGGRSCSKSISANSDF